MKMMKTHMMTHMKNMKINKSSAILNRKNLNKIEGNNRKKQQFFMTKVLTFRPGIDSEF